MFPSSIQSLISKFSRLPGVGPRTATRYVFYLLKLSQKELEELAQIILNLKKEIKICGLCFDYFTPLESHNHQLVVTDNKINCEDDIQGHHRSTFLTGFTAEDALCFICADSKRDKSTLLVVEKETDVQQIEKTKRYSGLYFILGGTIFSEQKMDFKNLRLKELEERVKTDKNIKEMILGFNPTVEGDATALYLKKQIQNWVGDKIKVTRLGRGLPMGGELEYADEETLSQALDSRK